MKRVVFVIHTLDIGGAEKSLVNLLAELNPNIYDVDLLLFRNEGAFLKQLPSYVNVVEIPPVLKKIYSPILKSGSQIFVKTIGTIISRIIIRVPEHRASFRWKYFYCNAIPKLEKKYDVAIAYVAGEPLYYVVDKINADIKLSWVHTDYRLAKNPKKYDVDYFEKVDAVASVSELCVDILKEEFPNISNKIYRIPNITSSKLVQERAKEFFPSEYNPNDKIIVSLGRLVKLKGFDLAINAASILKQKGIQFKWFVIGEGKYRKRLEELIKSENLNDCFFLLGARENPYPYIMNCTIFAQTSRLEGKSVALDEAKILAKPILSTSYPTVFDQIESGKEGILVSINAEEIAIGIEQLLLDKEMRQSLIDYLSNHEYGNQKDVSKYIELIEKQMVQ